MWYDILLSISDSVGWGTNNVDEGYWMLVSIGWSFEETSER